MGRGRPRGSGSAGARSITPSGRGRGRPRKEQSSLSPGLFLRCSHACMDLFTMLLPYFIKEYPGHTGVFDCVN